MRLGRPWWFSTIRLILEQRRHGLVERIQVLGNDGPQHGRINPAIFVAQHVAEAVNLLPWNFGPRGFQIVWNVLRGLGNDKQRVLNRPFHPPVGGENLGVCILGEIADTGDLFYTLRAIGKGTANLNNAANPRKIVFLNIPEAKDETAPRSGIKISDGQWYDPWGRAYKIAIDGTYDNQIANPYGSAGGAGSDPIRAGVIAWSLGKDTSLGKNGDGKLTGSDDVISWQ